MPELPEVESVKLQLQKFLIGHKVESADVKLPKIIQGDPLRLIDSKVQNVRRFAKVLVIDFDNGTSLVIHIKLTGQLIYRGPNLKTVPALSQKVVGGIPGTHTHLTMYFDRDGILYYNDVRRFGWVKVMPTKDVEKSDFIAKLGPEPAAAQGSGGQALLTLDKFKEITGSTKRAIKVVLMDQSKIAGIGNIYATDALWLAKINPVQPANTLSEKMVCTLYDAIEEVLKKGLATGGASELSFVTPDGSEGDYQNHFLAYGQEGKLCQRCKKEKLIKTKLSGRGTYFCPACQRLLV